MKRQVFKMTKDFYANADMVSMTCKESLQKRAFKLKYFGEMPIIVVDSVNILDSFWVRDCLEIDKKTVRKIDEGGKR